MARYFFDIELPHRRVRDDAGMDLPHEAQAIHEATQLVWLLLEDAEAQKRLPRVSIGIRAETGASIYELSTYADGHSRAT